MNTTETLTWISVGDSLPDADETVLLFSPDASEPAWPGYLDGDDADPVNERWRWADGSLVITEVTHYAIFPCGPERGRR